MGAPLDLVLSHSMLISDAEKLARDAATGDRIHELLGLRPRRPRTRLAILGTDLLRSAEHSVSRISGKSGQPVWTIELAHREVKAQTHPSGWVGGFLDPAVLYVDPRRFDPKRLRIARSGARLQPPAARSK